MKKDNGYYDGSIFLQSVLKGSVIGFVVTALLLCAFSAIMLILDMSASASKYFSVAALIIASFIGGFFAAKFSGEKGLITGASVGGALFLFISLISVIFAKEPIFIDFVIRLAATLPAAVVGGILGVNSVGKNKFKI